METQIEFELLGEELQQEITTVQEALALKNFQLDEVRRKLRKEMIEHQMVINKLQSHTKEMEDLKNQLDVNTKINVRLEEENAKFRESFAKLQLQMDSYVAERQLLMDRCYNADIELCQLRSQVEDLQDKLQDSMVYKEHYTKYQASTKNLIDQISKKQEVLQKEHLDLKKTFECGMSLASKLSEELNLQSLFIKESNITRIKMENEALRLIGVLEQERREKRNSLALASATGTKDNYLEDWRLSQEEMNVRIQFLTDINGKLLEELELLKAQTDLSGEKDNPST